MSHLTALGGKSCAAQPRSAKVRIVHVNFADGCCEVEQARSSSTALEFGVPWHTLANVMTVTSKVPLYGLTRSSQTMPDLP